MRQRKGVASRSRGSSLFGQVATPGGAGPQKSLIGKLVGANFNSVADQEITITAGYRVTQIIVQNASTSMTNADGGFYSAAAKAGTAIVLATQVYTALTGATIQLNVPIAVVMDGLTSVFFALTGAQGGAATADIYIYGLSP